MLSATGREYPIFWGLVFTKRFSLIKTRFTPPGPRRAARQGGGKRGVVTLTDTGSGAWRTESSRTLRVRETERVEREEAAGGRNTDENKCTLSRVDGHNGTEHYGDTLQENSMKTLSSKTHKRDGRCPKGSVRWEAIPALPRPLGIPAPCLGTLCFLTDHNQRRSRPHPLPALATCRNQQRMMSSYAHDLNKISHGIEPARLAASSTEAHDKPALCS